MQVDIETNKEPIKVDAYACAMRVKERFFGAMTRQLFHDMFTFPLKQKVARSMEKFYL